MGWSFSKRMVLSVSTLWGDRTGSQELAGRPWVGAKLRLLVLPGASCVLELGTGSGRHS